MKTKLIIASFLAATAVFSTLAHAGIDKSKQIVVQDVVSKNLNVSVTPTKKHYKVNEPIHFNVSGNKDFFLYVFSFDENNNNATLLFPNKSHTGNKFRSAHKNVIPSKKVKFVSDRPGKEKVVVIASTKYFQWNTKGYTTAGKFLQTSGDEFNKQVKAFRIRSRQATPSVSVAQNTAPVIENTGMKLQTADVQIQEVYTTITGDGSAYQNMVAQVQQQVDATANNQNTVGIRSNKEPAIVFSGTDKKVYKNGENVEILVGADKAGTLHLYTAEPNGKLVFLTKQKVDGKAFVKMTAQATAPFGTHALVVAYSKKDKINDGYLKKQYSKEALVGQTKGLRLIQKPEPVSYSVTQFRITE